MICPPLIAECTVPKVRPFAGDAEGFRHGIDRRPDHRMIDRLGHALAHEEDVHAAAAQRIEVVVGGDDRFLEVGPEGFNVGHGSLLAPTVHAFIVSLSL